MAGRRPLSRPRTRLYDYNYSLGEQLYKPMVERLDRKYSGHPAEAPESSFTRRPVSFAEADDTPRRRSLASLLGEMNSPANHTAPQIMANVEEEDELSSAALKRMRSARAGRSLTLDEALEDPDSISSRLRRRPKFELSNRLMETVGLKASETSDLESDSFFKRRTLRESADERNGLENGSLTKWTAYKPESARRALEAASAADAEEEAAAAMRAKRSRARIAEIESEMEELAERAAGRAGRRAVVAARLAEAAEMGDGSGDSLAASSTTATSVRVKKTSIHQSATAEKKMVGF